MDKCPCRPKSRVKLKPPWVATQNAMYMDIYMCFNYNIIVPEKCTLCWMSQKSMFPQNSRIQCHDRRAVMIVIAAEPVAGMILSRWVGRARSPGSSTTCRSRQKSCVEYLVWWCGRDTPRQWNPNHTYSVRVVHTHMYMYNMAWLYIRLFTCTKWKWETSS